MLDRLKGPFAWLMVAVILTNRPDYVAYLAGIMVIMLTFAALADD